MPMLQKMKPFNPVIGDDDPWVSMQLRNMPVGYHITDIVINQETHPKTYLLKDKFLGLTERFYRKIPYTVKNWADALKKLYSSSSTVSPYELKCFC